MSVLRQKTNKLFYKKWPYKIECTVGGAFAISMYRGSKFNEWMLAPLKKFAWRHITIVKSDVSKLRDAVLPFMDKVKLRGESKHLSIYTDDKQLVDTMLIALKEWATKVWEPSSDAELEFMTTNSHKKILRDELPYGSFTYKVLINHKCKSDKRIQFGIWINKYPEKIQPTKTTKRWLNDDSRWNYNPYIYVDDSKMLSMVCMYLGSDVSTIEEFILRSSINTV